MIHDWRHVHDVFQMILIWCLRLPGTSKEASSQRKHFCLEELADPSLLITQLALPHCIACAFLALAHARSADVSLSGTMSLCLFELRICTAFFTTTQVSIMMMEIPLDTKDTNGSLRAGLAF